MHGHSQVDMKCDVTVLAFEVLRVPQPVHLNEFFLRVTQKHEQKCVPHVQHDYFSCFNQYVVLWRSLLQPSSFLKLPQSLRSISNRKFKKRPQTRLRQPHKTIISLVKRAH